MASLIRLFVVSRFSLPAPRFFRREASVTATIQPRDKRCTNCYHTHTHTHTHTKMHELLSHTHTQRCMKWYSTYTHTHTKMHELLFHTHTRAHTQNDAWIVIHTHAHTHPHFCFLSPFTRQGQVGLHLMPWSHFFGGVNGDASTSCSEQLWKTMNPDCSLHL